MNALRIQEVTKTFDGVCAVDALSLEIPAGEVYGLLGPNGAGKTTTIRMILGILAPDSGAVSYEENGAAALQDRVGYLPEERGLYPKMRVLDLLVFLGEIKSLPRSEARTQGAHWLERFELAEWANRPVEQLSKGMQQKIQFIATILHDPDLLVLDEPFSGLDPINTSFLRDIMMDLKAEGKTLIFSTHQMEDAERICDRICLIDRGRKVLDGPIQDVKARFGKNRVVMAFHGDDGFLREARLVRKADNYGNYVEIELQPGADPQALLRRAMEGAEIQRFEVAEPSLREIFITAVGGEENGQNA